MSIHRDARYILIRHAEAEHHLAPITGGWTDSDLTERGRAQANLLAERLHIELQGRPARLLSSNLRRAAHTARTIGHWLELPVEFFDELRDINNGIAAGKTHAEAREHWNPPTEPIEDWLSYPGAESWRGFSERVHQFIRDLPHQEDELWIVVTHVAVVHAILDWWLGLPVSSPTSFGVDPASLTILGINGWGEHSLESLNDTAHLYRAGL